MKPSHPPGTTRPQLSHVPECCVHTSPLFLQGWELHCCPGQPVPGPEHSSVKEFILASKLNLPMCKLLSHIQELDSMILMCPFQLGIMDGSMILSFHVALALVSHVTACGNKGDFSLILAASS